MDITWEDSGRRRRRGAHGTQSSRKSKRFQPAEGERAASIKPIAATTDAVDGSSHLFVRDVDASECIVFAWGASPVSIVVAPARHVMTSGDMASDCGIVAYSAYRERHLDRATTGAGTRETPDLNRGVAPIALGDMWSLYGNKASTNNYSSPVPPPPRAHRSKTDIVHSNEWPMQRGLAAAVCVRGAVWVRVWVEGADSFRCALPGSPLEFRMERLTDCIAATLDAHGLSHLETPETVAGRLLSYVRHVAKTDPARMWAPRLLPQALTPPPVAPLLAVSDVAERAVPPMPPRLDAPTPPPPPPVSESLPDFDFLAPHPVPVDTTATPLEQWELPHDTLLQCFSFGDCARLFYVSGRVAATPGLLVARVRGTDGARLMLRVRGPNFHKLWELSGTGAGQEPDQWSCDKAEFDAAAERLLVPALQTRLRERWRAVRDGATAPDMPTHLTPVAVWARARGAVVAFDLGDTGRCFEADGLLLAPGLLLMRAYSDGHRSVMMRVVGPKQVRAWLAGELEPRNSAVSVGAALRGLALDPLCSKPKLLDKPASFVIGELQDMLARRRAASPTAATSSVSTATHSGSESVVDAVATAYVHDYGDASTAFRLCAGIVATAGLHLEHKLVCGVRLALRVDAPLRWRLWCPATEREPRLWQSSPAAAAARLVGVVAGLPRDPISTVMLAWPPLQAQLKARGALVAETRAADPSTLPARKRVRVVPQPVSHADALSNLREALPLLSVLQEQERANRFMLETELAELDAQAARIVTGEVHPAHVWLPHEDRALLRAVQRGCDALETGVWSGDSPAPRVWFEWKVRTCGCLCDELSSIVDVNELWQRYMQLQPAFQAHVFACWLRHEPLVI